MNILEKKYFKKYEKNIKPVVDILEIAGIFKPKKRVSALKLRV